MDVDLNGILKGNFFYPGGQPQKEKGAAMYHKICKTEKIGQP